VALKKVKATQVVCDSCGAIQVVTDLLDIVGYNGVVSEQGSWGGTGSVKWFACSAPCISAAVVNAIKESYSND
jgi:hypothetical protein